MELLLNYSKALFLEMVRDELIASLRSGMRPSELKCNLDKYYNRFYTMVSKQQKTEKTWAATSANKICAAELDGMRRVLAENVGERDNEDIIQELNSLFGSIDSGNYPIRFTFFCQEFDLFTSFKSVWESLEDDRFYSRNAVFVWENKAQDPIVSKYIRENYDDYHEMGIPVVDMTEYNLTEDQPDICFYMKPYYWVRGLPPYLHIDEVNKHTQFTAYISYCLDVQGGDKLFRFFYGMPAFFDMWKIIGYSRFYKEMATEYGFRRGENVEVIGHPKFDSIYEMLHQKDKWTDPVWEKKIAGRPVVLWNSHFSISPNEGVGTFVRWYKLIFDYFRKNKDIFLIWRPHPIFWQTIEREKSIDINEFYALLKELEEMDNVIVNKYGDYHYSFAMSDALISDAATFLVEYVPTGNPVLYTPKPDGEGVCDPNCTKELYIGDSVDSIISFLNQVRSHQDPRHDARMKNFADEYGMFDGKIGERIRDYLVRAMHEKTAIDAYNAVHGITDGV